MSKVIRVQESTLADFAHKIVELAGEGYEISGTNEGYPQSFGFGVYTCQMFASEDASKDASVKVDTKADKQEPVEAPQKPSEQRTESTSTSGQETDENAAQSTTGTQKPTARRGRRKATPKK